MNRWKGIRYRRPSINTYVLVATDTGLVVSTFYSAMKDQINKFGAEESVQWRESHGKYSWRFEHARDYGYTVTHWMKLPEAPANIQQQVQPDAVAQVEANVSQTKRG